MQPFETKNMQTEKKKKHKVLPDIERPKSGVSKSDVKKRDFTSHMEEKKIHSDPLHPRKKKKIIHSLEIPKKKNHQEESTSNDEGDEEEKIEKKKKPENQNNTSTSKKMSKISHHAEEGEKSESVEEFDPKKKEVQSRDYSSESEDDREEEAIPETRKDLRKKKTPEKEEPLGTFQNDTLDNPLYHFYEEISTHNGEQRYIFVYNLSVKFSIWPRKIKKEKIVEALKSDDYDETLSDFLDILLKKVTPLYSAWETDICKKDKLTFAEFVEKLDIFYGNMDEKSSKDGRHFMRKSTTSFRMKYNLTKNSTFGSLPDAHKQLPDFYQQLCTTKYGLEKVSVSYQMDRDKIHIDHQLSCQVFSAILKTFSIEYSFDRFYSWKTWLNKCWNFIMLPAKVNNRKGKMEAKIITLIDNNYNTQTNTFKNISCFQQMILNDYFCTFIDRFKAYAKKDFMDQTPKMKTEFINFLCQFDPSIQVNNLRDSYDCEPSCFCTKENQSKIERHRTYHLFTKIEFTDELKEFSLNIEDKFNKKMEQKSKKKKKYEKNKIARQKKRNAVIAKEMKKEDSDE